jgi:hypothetical protein
VLTVDAGFQVRPLELPQRDLLIGMYDRFDPLGEALGLPPRSAEARRDWIEAALGPRNWRCLSTRRFADAALGPRS